MSTANDTAIREQAYYFWEQDGRPEGRETEYWQRAVIALSDEATIGALLKPAPKRTGKAKLEPGKPEKAAKPLKAAATKAKAAPAKTAKPAAEKKPKKK